MRAVAPRTGAKEFTFGEEQEQYLPITAAAYPTNLEGCTMLVTRWKPSDEEREAIAKGEDIYVSQLVFTGKMTPQMVRVGPGDWRVCEECHAPISDAKMCRRCGHLNFNTDATS